MTLRSILVNLRSWTMSCEQKKKKSTDDDDRTTSLKDKDSTMNVDYSLSKLSLSSFCVFSLSFPFSSLISPLISPLPSPYSSRSRARNVKRPRRSPQHRPYRRRRRRTSCRRRPTAPAILRSFRVANFIQMARIACPARRQFSARFKLSPRKTSM